MQFVGLKFWWHRWPVVWCFMDFCRKADGMLRLFMSIPLVIFWSLGLVGNGGSQWTSRDDPTDLSQYELNFLQSVSGRVSPMKTFRAWKWPTTNCFFSVDTGLILRFQSKNGLSMDWIHKSKVVGFRRQDTEHQRIDQWDLYSWEPAPELWSVSPGANERWYPLSERIINGKSFNIAWT